MAYKNDEDKKAAAARHYQANRAKYLAKEKAKRAKIRQLLQEAKNHPCMDCGSSYPYYVMDFDHRPGEDKIFNPSEATTKSERLLLEEIAKCDLVCANCHRFRTHARRSPLV